jgi:hypothetical protein
LGGFTRISNFVKKDMMVKITPEEKEELQSMFTE